MELTYALGYSSGAYTPDGFEPTLSTHTMVFIPNDLETKMWILQNRDAVHQKLSVVKHIALVEYWDNGDIEVHKRLPAYLDQVAPKIKNALKDLGFTIK